MGVDSETVCSSPDVEQEREEELSLRQTITIEVAAANDLSSALEVVLRRVCEKTRWAFGQAWLPNADGTALDCGAAWLSGTDLEPFRVASQQAHVTPGLGITGRAWKSKRSTWVEDF